MALTTPYAVRAALVLSTLVACAPSHRDLGRYRVLDVGDNFFGLQCQTRQEFYFLPLSSEKGEPTYLGTCGTPGFITDQVHMPGDPSCFAVSEGGVSIVYLHRPELCGAGAKAEAKLGGIYVHSAIQGDRLLYPSSQVLQTWGGAEVARGAMRITWIGRTPSRAGAVSNEAIMIHADGHEVIDGHPYGSRPQ
jgi:hypothetical protein